MAKKKKTTYLTQKQKEMLRLLRENPEQDIILCPTSNGKIEVALRNPEAEALLKTAVTLEGFSLFNYKLYRTWTF